MKCAEAGSYCCPYGLSSYVYVSPAGKIIFTGLRMKGVYDKKKAKIAESQEYVYNPVIEESACASIAQEAAISLFEKQEPEGKLEAIRDLLHETRSLRGKNLYKKRPGTDFVSIPGSFMVRMFITDLTERLV